MKKTVLFSSSLLFSFASVAQFTQENEPQLNDSKTMYVLDPTAPSYAANTGATANWDYSNVHQDADKTRDISVELPGDVPSGNNFPSATKAVVIQNYATTYFTSDANTRHSKGYTFNDPTAGPTDIVFNDANDEIVMEYPFDYGDTKNDTYTGVAKTTDYGNLNCTGTSITTVDGVGTLKLTETSSFSNVTRYKLFDSTVATIPFVGSVKVTRVQYEYYDLTVDSLPLFVHTTLTFRLGTAAPNVTALVLSAVKPTVGINENTLLNLSVLPNPATDRIQVTGLTADAQLRLVDAQGKQVAEATVSATDANLTIAGVSPGMYLLHITSEGLTSTKRVVIQ